ncbi:MAG: type II secretion system F family protein, partial [Gallionellaceae bacterium]|nr:type II secretion system F family protein [Gallionellaceae bacterium]
MPLYRYKAVAPTGEVQEGEMEDLGHDVVVNRLQGMGLIPIRVEEAAASTGASFGAGSTGSNPFRKGRISQADIAVFTREIATLLRAGLPLDRSLGILISMSPNPQVLQLLTQVREDVRGGAALSAAMEAQSGVFSRFYLNMIRAGEAGGALDEVLQRLS